MTVIVQIDLSTDSMRREVDFDVPFESREPRRWDREENSECDANNVEDYSDLDHDALKA